MSDQANGYVVADAIKMLPQDAAPSTATWTPNLTVAGNYNIYARWTAHPNRATNAAYTVTHANGSSGITVNQQQNGGVWNLLGSFNLEVASNIRLTDQANGSVIADAIKLVASNVAPAVSLTSPANGATAAAPGSFTLSADASDSDGTIARVDFYAGTTLIGTATAAPYSYTWSNVAVGSYSLTAVATDTLNATTTSTPVTVTVNSGSAQAYYIYTDHLDTPRQITDASGNVVWQWDNSDPFGANMANENPNGAGQFSFNLRFPGQYYDRETNLHYNYFRDYDPSTGRYIQSDPIGLRGGINTYGYVGGNPISFVDPLGLVNVDPNSMSRMGGGGGGDILIMGGIAIINAIINSSSSSTTESASTSDQAKKKDQCEDDDCSKLAEQINRAKNGIARRFRQLAENAGGIDQATHWEQLRGRQRNLRELLNKAAAKGCQVPSDAWYWASK